MAQKALTHYFDLSGKKHLVKHSVASDAPPLQKTLEELYRIFGSKKS